MNRQQSVVVGAFLIGLGLVAWLHLWWLIWPGALAVAGGAAYLQRRRMGRTDEAVQAGLWLIGLSVLFMLHFVFPGLLFLAGASILIRGREQQVDNQVQAFLAGFAKARINRANLPSQRVPVTTVPSATPVEHDATATGETTRL